MTETFAQRKRFYNEHLTKVILPFWLPKTDKKFGGFFTCYDPLGKQLVSKDKYVWSQGRCTWMYSKLAASSSVDLNDEVRGQCFDNAKMGADFLREHCILPDGTCAFRLAADNTPLELYPGSGYAVSTFADCFVILGLSAAGVLLKDYGLVQLAAGLYYAAAELLESGQFKTAPDVIPDGWKSHAARMIMVNTGDELSESFRAFKNDGEAAKVDGIITGLLDDISCNFISRTGIVYECLDANNEPLDTLYGRHINPGHTNESMWFLIHAAARLDKPEIIEKAVRTVEHTSKLAWDEKYGGMMYYLDKDGGMPKGTAYEAEKELADAAVRDWSNKLWWTHTETIYANLLCYSLTGRKSFLDTYEMYHDYTFRTFPNPDKEIGEWIQLRNRDGSPNLGQIGGRLPVKDPYHITRNLMLLIQLLEEMEVNDLR